MTGAATGGICAWWGGWIVGSLNRLSFAKRFNLRGGSSVDRRKVFTVCRGTRDRLIVVVVQGNRQDQCHASACSTARRQLARESGIRAHSPIQQPLRAEARDCFATHIAPLHFGGLPSPSEVGGEAAAGFGVRMELAALAPASLRSFQKHRRAGALQKGPLLTAFHAFRSPEYPCGESAYPSEESKYPCKRSPHGSDGFAQAYFGRSQAYRWLAEASAKLT